MNRIAGLALLVTCSALCSGSALAQVSPRPPDAVVPVVGSTRGQSNANFKTELQLANPTASTMSGFLYLRPHGLFRRYELAPHTTLSFEDVVADIGGTGLGSLDVLTDGGALPTIVARAYDDQPAGSTGVTVPAIATPDVLARPETGTLIAPRDLGGRYRFNIGTRALDNGATLELTVWSPTGTQRHARTLVLPENQFTQQTGDAFAGIALQSNDTIVIRLDAGSAIIYATTVDNVTNDSSIQVLRK